MRRAARPATVVIFALIVAACGTDDGAEETTTMVEETTTMAPDTTEGSEDTAAPETTSGGEETDNPYLADDWTNGGTEIPDYSQFDMSGETILWADFGGPTHEDYRNAYLDPFRELTGVEIVDASPFDYAQVRAQVESGNIQYDIITGVDYAIQEQCGTLYEELPESKFYRGHLPEQLTESPCVVPHGTTVFLPFYHRETYQDNPPESCADFFDLENYPGSRAIWNSSVGIPFEIALLADGVAPEDMYPIDYDRALAKYETIREELDFFSPLGRAQEGMTNEEWDMLIGFTASGLRVERAEGNIAYEPVWPCAIAQTQSLGILKGTPRLDANLAISGYATTPEAQSRGMLIRGSSPPLLSEFVEVPDELEPWMEKYHMFFHEDEMVLQYQNATWWSERFDEGEQIWQQWQVG